MASLNGNGVVAQSGGPSVVINASLKGVIDGWNSFAGRRNTLYGAECGIEGVLTEDLINLTEQDSGEIGFLRTTPAAGQIGTCRYKLQTKHPEDWDRIVEVFKAHDIRYFFYNGGNDSMDTANKVSRLCAEKGHVLTAVGVPKTIDQDVGGSLNFGTQTFEVIDHTPGYGSCALYWAWKVKQCWQECYGSRTHDRVIILQVMGRKIGFIPAASIFADLDVKPIIAMAEAGLSVDELYEGVCEGVKQNGAQIVVLSEGYAVQQAEEVRDAFGHQEFGKQIPAGFLLAELFKKRGLPFGGGARFNVAGTDQRNDNLLISPIDNEEAYQVGAHAVKIAVSEGNGYMATLIRHPGEGYRVSLGHVRLEVVANSERKFPEQWITKDKMYVTEQFRKWCDPLLGDTPMPIPMEGRLPRFARLDQSLKAEKRCREYVPQGRRADRMYKT